MISILEALIYVVSNTSLTQVSLLIIVLSLYSIFQIGTFFAHIKRWKNGIYTKIR